MTPLTEIADGVLVGTSERFTTTTTVVIGPDHGCLLIDPAVTPGDLAELAAELAGRGLAPRAGWATHPHWDHVLWSQALGDVPRYTAPRAAATALAERDGLVSGVQESAPGHDLALFGQLVALPPGATAVPWDGPAAQVVIHDGHAPGHGAVFLPGTGTLIAGDMCSDIEIPLPDWAEPDPLGDYRTGLDRLGALAGQVQHVVPGHGHVGDGAEFRRRLTADLAYLDTLALGEPFDDPRLTEDWLRGEHDKALACVSEHGAAGRGAVHS
ncbi:MAG TPA: MBL fold metallo-hydrolase [Streptosporangiaceae bacterium]